jgi:DNA polymerase-3 subunit epsilon
MLEWLLTPDHRRRRLAHAAPDGPLKAFLSTPFPDADRDCREVDYVALDLETTGLDPQRDAIISVGMVGLRGTRIELGTAEHRIVRVDRAMPEASVIVHRLTDDAVARGEPLARVLADVLRRLAGKALVAHHARVEFQFLRRACAAVFGGEFLAPVVDTERLARQWFERRDKPYSPRDLRLSNLRARYNLPRYPAHNALSDALACGELFAAQVAERESRQPMPLKAFLAKP